MRIFNGLADLEASVGEDLGTSSWHRVTQENIDQFAQATGDHQWIHVDVERAKAGPFGATIAHGFLALSLFPVLMAELFSAQGLAMMVNYGTDKVRFAHPIVVGSNVRAHAVIDAVTPRPGGALLRIRGTLEIEGVDKPACVAEMLTLVVA